MSDLNFFTLLWCGRMKRGRGQSWCLHRCPKPRCKPDRPSAKGRTSRRLRAVSTEVQPLIVTKLDVDEENVAIELHKECLMSGAFEHLDLGYLLLTGQEIVGGSLHDQTAGSREVLTASLRGHRGKVAVSLGSWLRLATREVLCSSRLPSPVPE